MRHQKMSSLLVLLAGKAAAQGDSALFGLLFDLEGDSLRMSGDLMITGDKHTFPCTSTEGFGARGLVTGPAKAGVLKGMEMAENPQAC